MPVTMPGAGANIYDLTAYDKDAKRMVKMRRALILRNEQKTRQ